MRHVSLLGLLALMACGGSSDSDLTSGTIRSVMNISSSNVNGFDAAVDPYGSRDAFVIGAVQVGEADYGSGTLGYADGTPQLVFGRYDSEFQPLWLTKVDGALTSTQPYMATQSLGYTATAFGEFTDTVSIAGGAALATPVAALFSDADGSVRWSVSLAETVASHVAGVIIDGSGDVVVARNTDETPTRIKLDRLTQAAGTLVVSRAVGLGTGNARLLGMTYDVDGNLVIVARFDGTVTLDQTYTAPDGMFYGYVAKIGRDSGNALWSRPLRFRTDEERVVVGILDTGDVTLAGPFGFVDDTTDTTNPVSTVRYLRTALLANATGATSWTRRDDLVNAASLDIVDTSDFAADLYVVATFNGTVVFDSLTASTTVASSMAAIRFSASDGTPVWMNYSGTSSARGTRIGALPSGDILSVGTFTASGATTSSVFAIQIVE